MKGETGPVRGEHTLPLEGADGAGEGAAVHAEVVRQGLPVKGDGDGAPPRPVGQLLQIGQQPLSDGAGYKLFRLKMFGNSTKM